MKNKIKKEKGGVVESGGGVTGRYFRTFMLISISLEGFFWNFLGLNFKTKFISSRLNF